MTIDELWEKYALDEASRGGPVMCIGDFREALTEYGEHIKAQDESECICRVNFRQIIKEYSPYFGDTYLDRDGNKCTFFGIVWGDDDLYYGMFRQDTKTVALLSCVGSIEGFDYTRCATAIEKMEIK